MANDRQGRRGHLALDDFDAKVDDFHEQILDWDPREPLIEKDIPQIPMVFGGAADYRNCFFPLILMEAKADLSSTFNIFLGKQEPSPEDTKRIYPTAVVLATLHRVEKKGTTLLELTFQKIGAFNTFDYVSIKMKKEGKEIIAFGIVYTPAVADPSLLFIKVNKNRWVNQMGATQHASAEIQAWGKISPSHRTHACVALIQNTFIPFFRGPMTRQEHIIEILKSMSLYLKYNPILPPSGSKKQQKDGSGEAINYQSQFKSLCSYFCPYKYESYTKKKRPRVGAACTILTHTFTTSWADTKSDAFELCCKDTLEQIADFNPLHFSPSYLVKSKRKFEHPSNLNSSQTAAIERIHDFEELVTLVQGPPGTGKTTTLISAVIEFYKRDERAIVTAPSNAAVGEVAIRAIQSNEIPLSEMTLYGLSTSIDPSGPLHLIYLNNKIERFQLFLQKILNLMQDTLDYNHDRIMERIQDIQDSLDSFISEIIPFTGRSTFTYEYLTIVDKIGEISDRSREIGKFTPTAEEKKWLDSRRGLLNEKVDPLLSGGVRGYLEAFFLSQSMLVFCTLSQCSRFPIRERAGPFKVLVVDEASQATEPQTVLSLLLPVEKAVLIGDPKQLGSIGKVKTANHLYRKNPFLPLLFFDVQNGKEEKLMMSYYNTEEANFICALVKTLIEEGANPEAIGVITFYTAQLNLLLDKLSFQQSLRVHTVDGFQGKEMDIIIVSFVRANSNGVMGFIRQQRLNVALTRAKSTLLLVGNKRTLESCQSQEGLFLDLVGSTPSTPCNEGMNLKNILGDHTLGDTEQQKKRNEQLEVLLEKERIAAEQIKALQAERLKNELKRVKQEEKKRILMLNIQTKHKLIDEVNAKRSELQKLRIQDHEHYSSEDDRWSPRRDWREPYSPRRGYHEDWRHTPPPPGYYSREYYPRIPRDRRWTRSSDESPRRYWRRSYSREYYPRESPRRYLRRSDSRDGPGRYPRENETRLKPTRGKKKSTSSSADGYKKRTVKIDSDSDSDDKKTRGKNRQSKKKARATSSSSEYVLVRRNLKLSETSDDSPVRGGNRRTQKSLDSDESKKTRGHKNNEKRNCNRQTEDETDSTDHSKRKAKEKHQKSLKRHQDPPPRKQSRERFSKRKQHSSNSEDYKKIVRKRSSDSTDYTRRKKKHHSDSD